MLISDNFNSSAVNAPTAFEYECHEIKDDTPQFNYHGPKIKIPKQESPLTMCTADTIGIIQSQRLLQVLFDSGSNVFMIKRSALPKGVVKKLLCDTKLVRILAGCLKTQEVVMMWDIRLPEFDKNRRITQQKVLVFDNDYVNTTSSKVRTLFPRLEYSWTTQKETWKGLIAPSHFVHLEGWIQMSLSPWKTCFTSKSKTRSSVNIGLNALQLRFWMPRWKDRCSWGCKRSHSSKHTSKSRFAQSG
jgi:hypothetical protein